MKQIKYQFLLVLSIYLFSCEVLKPEGEAAPGNRKLIDSGIASWYGPGFHGKKTASGEIFDTGKLTAAHRTLPFGTRLTVRNMANGKEVTVRINDRGPFAKDRIIDLSKAAAARLDMIGAGTAEVRLYLKGNEAVPDVDDIKKASYTIQIASYTEKSNANQKAAEVPLGWVKSARIKGKTVYRVFAGKFNDTVQAEAHLTKLRRKGINGFVKQVEN